MRLTIYQIGISIGLVSISFFFGALLLAYWFRIEQQPSLHRFQVPPVLWLSTVALLLSSILLESARWRLRRARTHTYLIHLTGATILGIVFLVLQTAAGVQLLSEGVAPEANPRGSMFYVFMVLHGAHLTGGVWWLFHLRFASRRLVIASETNLRNQRRSLSVAAIYWHFMGLLWLVLFYFLLHWSV